MKKTFITLALLLAACGSWAQTPTADDYNRAVMQVYDQMLAEDPNDYGTLFRRANAFFNRGEYLRALDDLDKAIKLAPANDGDSRFALHALRAETLCALKQYGRALPDAAEALKIEPTSTAMLALRGDTYVNLGQFTEAKDDFNRLLRLQPRSTEAYFGLATVAAKEKNLGLVNDYIDKGQQLAQSKANAFVRTARVKEILGDYDAAVTALLQAAAADANDPDALPALVQLASSNYTAVINGLTAQIKQQPRQPFFYFLRGSIAAAHYHYVDAIKDFNFIISENLYSMNSLYADLAECYYALGDFDTALANIDKAIAGAVSDVDDDPVLYHTVRSRILRASGKFDDALKAADRALEFGPDNAGAMMQKALVQVSLHEPQKASALIGEVIMNDPHSPMPYMTRAWVLNDFLNQQTAAKGIYGQIINLDLDRPENASSMLGFAQLFDGKTPQAIAWMDAILAQPDHDGMNHYYGACFYAWAGKTDKALDCMEAALKAGYADRYDWLYNIDSRVNVVPLRQLPRFKQLMEQYQSLFKVS